MCKAVLLPAFLFLSSPFHGSAAPPPAGPTVIQGRITALQGPFVSVKTPDVYPPGPGRRSLYVASGPTFRVNLSNARFLLPDGQRVDRKPLRIGERVVVALSASSPGPPVSPRTPPPTYFAIVIERQASSDNITGP